MKKDKNGYSRRSVLAASAAGGAGFLLRSLATGLPPAYWLSARRAAAEVGAEKATALILATSSAGDPLNVNCPGAYVAGVVDNHPDANLSPQTVSLGGTTVQGAAPWAALPEKLRQKLSFFHHRTHAAAHTEHYSTLTMRGAVKGPEGNGAEHLASAMSAELATGLGTVQREPIGLDKALMTFEGRALQQFTPAALKGLFSQSTGQLADLRSLRDKTLDALYADIKSTGSRSQRAFLDRYALGRDQAREVGVQLGGLLARLPLGPDDVYVSSDQLALEDMPENGPEDQILTAVALLKLKITPVVTVKIPFGGDNHKDGGLGEELEGTLRGVALIRFLFNELESAGLSDQATFAMLNVFGRKLKTSGDGRGHNGKHNVMVSFGPSVRAGVHGGVTAEGCTAVDPQSGASGGAIPAEQTLESAGKSLGLALGLSRERIDKRINGGQVVEAFVTST